MKRDSLYIILLILEIGLFTTNFTFFRMKNDLLTTATTITIIIGIVMILRDHFQRMKERKEERKKINKIKQL